jgi:hypothetical protein
MGRIWRPGGRRIRPSIWRCAISERLRGLGLRALLEVARGYGGGVHWSRSDRSLRFCACDLAPGRFSRSESSNDARSGSCQEVTNLPKSCSAERMTESKQEIMTSSLLLHGRECAHIVRCRLPSASRFTAEYHFRQPHTQISPQ